MEDDSLDLLAARGGALEFRKLLQKDATPEVLRSKVVIAESPHANGRYLVGKFDYFERASADGTGRVMLVTLRPQSRGDYPRQQWTIPIEKWPESFRPIAVLR